MRNYILPDWWDDAETESNAGFMELVLRLSSRLGISADSLVNENSHLSFDQLDACKFKGEARLNDHRDVAVSICKRAAEIASYAMMDEHIDLAGKSGKQIREEILANGNSCVDLRNLTEYCWLHGVPVLHITNFPKGVNKPDGMLMVLNDRPAIVICKKQKQPAWLLFILAHELGHLIAGHADQNCLIVDVKLNDGEGNRDIEEQEADSNALEILTGESSKSYRSSSGILKAKKLADAARRKGHDDSVYAGHIVLNYTNGLGGEFHGLGNAALKFLYPSANAQATLNDCLAKHLDWSNLPEDNAKFLMRIAGTDAVSV